MTNVEVLLIVLVLILTGGIVLIVEKLNELTSIVRRIDPDGR